MIDKLKIYQESELEALFYEQLEQAGLHEGIKWQHPIKGHKVDFCRPDIKVIIEIQGGTDGFGKGRGSHVREPGYSNDRMFSNLRQLEGWIVLEFTATQVRNEMALFTAQRVLEMRTQ